MKRQNFAPGQPNFQANPTQAPFASEPGENDPLTEVIQGAALQPVPPAAYGGYALERPSGPTIIDWFLDAAAARKHREVMTTIRDASIEGQEAMAAASQLAADFVANSLETEHFMEREIRNHQDSRMALANAPTYAQIGRTMQMQSLPEIAQAAINRIKRKIEQR